MFCAPADDRWGYVTAGGSEGILHGLWLGRSLFPRLQFQICQATIVQGEAIRVASQIVGNGSTQRLDSRGRIFSVQLDDCANTSSDCVSHYCAQG